MYENVVAFLLWSEQLRVRSEPRCRQAEDNFYDQFGDPLPRWITGPMRFLGRLLGKSSAFLRRTRHLVPLFGLTAERLKPGTQIRPYCRALLRRKGRPLPITSASSFATGRHTARP